MTQNQWPFPIHYKAFFWHFYKLKKLLGALRSTFFLSLAYLFCFVFQGWCISYHCYVWYVLDFPLRGIGVAEAAVGDCRQAKWVLSLCRALLVMLSFKYNRSRLDFVFVTEAQDWAMKERDSEADPLNIWLMMRWQTTTSNSWQVEKQPLDLLHTLLKFLFTWVCNQFLSEDDRKLYKQKIVVCPENEEKRDGDKRSLNKLFFW